jgi:hypothetical protein
VSYYPTRKLRGRLWLPFSDLPLWLPAFQRSCNATTQRTFRHIYFHHTACSNIGLHWTPVHDLCLKVHAQCENIQNGVVFCAGSDTLLFIPIHFRFAPIKIVCIGEHRTMSISAATLTWIFYALGVGVLLLRFYQRSQQIKQIKSGLQI